MFESVPPDGEPRIRGAVVPGSVVQGEGDNEDHYETGRGGIAERRDPCDHSHERIGLYRLQPRRRVHVRDRYAYHAEYGIVIHPDNWRWRRHEHYVWHEHEGRGYWHNGIWITF